MKFLIVNTNYDAAVDWLYSQEPQLLDRPYEEHQAAYERRLPSTGHFYALNLRKLGHEVEVVMANNEPAQRAWARREGLAFPGPGWRAGLSSWWRGLQTRTPIRQLRRRIGHRLPPPVRPGWFHTILAQQIQRCRPDVLLNLAIDDLGPAFMAAMKPYAGTLVGEGDANMPLDRDYSCYDLVRCSLPDHVRLLRSRGIRTELYRFGFEPGVLERTRENGRRHPLTFVGSLSPAHHQRREMIRAICERFECRVWSHGLGDRDENVAAQGGQDPLRRNYQGPAWGYQMYQVLRDSRITLNCQIDSAGPYADNMRLYEATGSGTLLLTDRKENLPQLFTPGEELVAYESTRHCAELIEHYLRNEPQRRAIAAAGTARTLREHTYHHRMQELLRHVA